MDETIQQNNQPLINKQISALQIIGQLVEIASVIFLGLLMLNFAEFLLGKNDIEKPAMFSTEILRLFVILGTLSFVSALFIAGRVKKDEHSVAIEENKKEKEKDEKEDYEISCGRLETLKVVGVPKDVTDYLEKIKNSTLKRKELEENLCDYLGEVRTQEWIDTILKYTKKVIPQQQTHGGKEKMK